LGADFDCYCTKGQKRMSKIRFHEGDLPDLEHYNVDAVAVDTETLGLNPYRDRLCLVQLSPGDGRADIVRIERGQREAPNLTRLLGNIAVEKIFHYGRFDIAILMHTFGIEVKPVFCTKIASKLTRTYTERHGLREICAELLEVSISKQQQSSDWAAEKLSQAQLDYAAADVLYLHRLRDILAKRLKRDGRSQEAQACFDFLPMRARLDLMGWGDSDIFAHT